MKVLQCGPGNKQCGKRCIPQKYRCKDTSAFVDVTDKVGKVPDFKEVSPNDYEKIKRSHLSTSSNKSEPGHKKFDTVANVALAVAGVGIAAAIIAGQSGKQEMSTALGSAGIIAMGISSAAVLASMVSQDMDYVKNKAKAKREAERDGEIERKKKELKALTAETKSTIEKFESEVDKLDPSSIVEFVVKTDNPSVAEKVFYSIRGTRVKKRRYEVIKDNGGLIIRYNADGWEPENEDS